jgi:pimeloyl-ACP methyl ester carboxylesterase
MRTLRRTAIALALVVAASMSNAAMAAPVKNIVLVHGFFADGSGWKGVADILIRDGFHVAVVQEPETSFAEDVRATTRALDAMDGNSILVGHSYGGAVITEAGNHPKAAGLVYVSAFEPDVGESLKSLIGQKPPASDSIKATADGYLYIDPAQFRADFAADLPAAEAKFMALSQVMPAAQLASVPVTQAAWKTKPSWAVISTTDRTVNPDLQREMAKRAGSKVTEIKGSHAAFIAHPAEVAKVIEQAAAATGQ